MMVRKKTDVHEKTVQKVARGEITKRQHDINKRTRSSRRPANSRVTTQEIDPLLKAWIAENKIPAEQIQIVDSKAIIVKNPKARKR